MLREKQGEGGDAENTRNERKETERTVKNLKCNVLGRTDCAGFLICNVSLARISDHVMETYVSDFGPRGGRCAPRLYVNLIKRFMST
jgi:hypothetical protein